VGNDKRFSVGIDGRSGTVPKGRLRNATRIQPSLRDLEGFALDPTLKRWAILMHPSGMENEILVALDKNVRAPGQEHRTAESV
jgi:hypothetical protein